MDHWRSYSGQWRSLHRLRIMVSESGCFGAFGGVSDAVFIGYDLFKERHD